MRPAIALDVERDGSERLSPDDTATVREQEFLAAALGEQRLAAQRAEPVTRGQCANCGEHLPPKWVYCDEDCRADHESRQTIERRLGHSK